MSESLLSCLFPVFQGCYSRSWPALVISFESLTGKLAALINDARFPKSTVMVRYFGKTANRRTALVRRSEIQLFSKTLSLASCPGFPLEEGGFSQYCRFSLETTQLINFSFSSTVLDETEKFIIATRKNTESKISALFDHHPTTYATIRVRSM